jgi:hypothetical protein
MIIIDLTKQNGKNLFWLKKKNIYLDDVDNFAGMVRKNSARK